MNAAGKLKMVSPDDQMIKEAKLIGISFGDYRLRTESMSHELYCFISEISP